MNKKLSVIGVVRNDEYGMYLRERLTGFFKSIQECKYDIELVLIEWNPPSFRQSFYDEYKDIIPTNKKIKIVTVPNEIHNKIKNSELFPVFEYLGKNVGARHSSGDYILFTNPDNIFVESLWDQIFDNLDNVYFLRAARSDVNYVNIDFKNLNVNEIVSLLPHKITHSYDNSGNLFYNASGDFLCVSKNKFSEVCCYDELLTYSHIDSFALNKLNKHGMKQKVLNEVTYHIDHLRPHLRTMNRYGLETSEYAPHTYNKNWGLLGEELKIKEYNNN
jgi:hypothetical protein